MDPNGLPFGALDSILPYPNGCGSKNRYPNWVALVSGNMGNPKPAVCPSDRLILSHTQMDQDRPREVASAPGVVEAPAGPGAVSFQGAAVAPRGADRHKPQVAKAGLWLGIRLTPKCVFV